MRMVEGMRARHVGTPAHALHTNMQCRPPAFSSAPLANPHIALTVLTPCTHAPPPPQAPPTRRRSPAVRPITAGGRAGVGGRGMRQVEHPPSSRCYQDATIRSARPGGSFALSLVGTGRRHVGLQGGTVEPESPRLARVYPSRLRWRCEAAEELQALCELYQAKLAAALSGDPARAGAAKGAAPPTPAALGHRPTSSLPRPLSGQEAAAGREARVGLPPIPAERQLEVYRCALEVYSRALADLQSRLA